MEIDFDAKAAHLYEHGYVVMDVMAPSEVAAAHFALMRDVAAFPEFVPGTSRHVYNSFGAFGNASSFHNMSVRAIRSRVRAPVAEPLMRALVRHRFPDDPERQRRYRLETLIDRMGIRRKGTTTTPETWHRDTSVTPTPLDGDEPDDVFGGWVNLDLSFDDMRRDPLNAQLWTNGSRQKPIEGVGRNCATRIHIDTTQYFSCHPGTHRGMPRGAAGFAPLTDAEVEAFSLRQKTIVPIRPGQWVIFYQNLVHEVNRRMMAFNSLRSYLGLRLTTQRDNLFDTRANPALLARRSEFVRDGPPGWNAQDYNFFTDLARQAVPKLPSSQQSPTYAVMNHVTTAGLVVAWASEVFQPCVLLDGTPARAPRFMRSLAEYGLPLYPAYTDAELALFTPRLLFA